jgi:hemin uptake protein HemP
LASNGYLGGLPMNTQRPVSLSIHRVCMPKSAPYAGELVLESSQLLDGRKEILIRHGEKLYRLRHTSNDKLILTK